MKNLMKNCPNFALKEFESYKKVETLSWHLFICNPFRFLKKRGKGR